MMGKVIIGIHGRSNKPPREILSADWRRAIAEGLDKNQRMSPASFDFELVYYADVFYPGGPLSESEYSYKEAPPGPLPSYKRSLWNRVREKTRASFEDQADWVERNLGIFSGAAQPIYKRLLEDLGQYYQEGSLEREATQARLRDTLLTHKFDEIMLIAHSMGSIVAYDVLRDMGRRPVYERISVAHFVTIGSPLGLPPVEGENLKGHHDRLRTPSLITSSWVNFSDLNDVVCLDPHLGDDYDANSLGVKVRDQLVSNTYPNNPHQSHGYLRTPELSDHIEGFL
jgi:hypothetical protein